VADPGGEGRLVEIAQVEVVAALTAEQVIHHSITGETLGRVSEASADDVAAAVLKAIERNRSEIDVAPVSLRVGTALAGLLPELSGRVQRRLGSLDVAEALAEGQRDKR